MTPWLLLALACLLLVGNAVFVAAETALVTVERSEVDADAEQALPRAVSLAGALTRLSTHLSAAQLGITVTSLAIGLLAEPSLARLLQGPLSRLGLEQELLEPIAVALALLLASAVQMVFGELVPKNLALARPLRTAYGVLRPQLLFAAVTRPLVLVLNGAANRLLGMGGIEPAEELRSARTPEELSMLVQQSAERGRFVPGAAQLLANSLLFGDLRAADVMTPRVRVRFLADDASVSSVLRAARQGGHSRFPVVTGPSEEVVGLVHVKHAIAVPAELRRTRRVRDIMSAPVLVPSSVNVHALLGTLRARGMQLAVVIDEFGGTAGVVTLEDIVEELVGEVRDETDLDGEEQRARQRRDGAWLLSGLLRPDEVAALTAITIPQGPYETLGGLVQHRLGRVGKVGDELRLESGAVLRVEQMQVRRVAQVVIAPPPPTDPPDSTRWAEQ